MSSLRVFICAAAFFLCMPVLYGHGTDFTFFDGGTGFRVTMENGAPMRGALVEIYPPGTASEIYQEGRTDRNGAFVFAPDTSGEWRIEITGGHGHGIVKRIQVDENMSVEISEASGQLNTLQKIVLGVSIIFGITGIGYGFSMRKRNTNNR